MGRIFVVTRIFLGRTMKRFFVAVCCIALFGLNVSAQEASVVDQDNPAKSVIVQAPDSEATFASQDETPQPDIPEIQESSSDDAPVVVQEDAATTPPAPTSDVAPAVVPGQVVEGSVVGGMIVEGSACSGCAQPMMSQSMTYSVQGSGCGCAQPAMMTYTAAAPVQSCCPQTSPTCCAPQPTCCPQPSCDPCCNTRVTLRDRLAARRAARTARRCGSCCY
jgi:hypothetical protein